MLAYLVRRFLPAGGYEKVGKRRVGEQKASEPLSR
jgi:hypothetical protein